MDTLLNRRDVFKWAPGAASLAYMPAFADTAPIAVALSGPNERARQLLGNGGVWRLVKRAADAEIVWITASPSERAAVSVEALRADKHMITELPAALTLDDCQALVEASEQAGRHCYLFESGCYAMESLFVLGLFSAGLLGDALFAETGFCSTVGRTEGMTLAARALPPVGWYMKTNRGDRIRSVAAIGSPHVQNALLATEQGRAIALSQNTATPRPDEGLVRIQGTKGVYSGMSNGVFVDGRSPEAEAFEPVSAYSEYEPRLLRGSIVAADALCLRRIAWSLRGEQPPDCDVYDAAVWSAVPLLAATSIARHGEPIECPDFTRGQWRDRAPIRAERMD